MIGILFVPTGHRSPETLAHAIGGVPLVVRQTRLLEAFGADVVHIVGSAPVLETLRPAFAHRLGKDLRVEWHGGGAQEAVGLLDGERAIALRVDAVFERGPLGRFYEAADAVAASTTATTADGSAVGAAHLRPDDASELAGWLHDPSDAAPETSRLALDSADAYRGEISDEAARQRVEHALWEGCRKPVDGFVSRNLNRHISLFVSKRIAHLGITPNHVSTFTLMLGIAGAACAAQGTYLGALAGGTLLKLNSILDGVDGELARMRIESSVLGEWLDTISDDVSNQLFFLAVGFGAWQMSGAFMWMALAIAAVTPLFLTSAIYYRWLIKIGRGDVLAFDWFQPHSEPEGTAREQTLVSRVTDFLTMLFRRDSFVAMLFVCSLLGIVHWSLFVVAPAGWITFSGLAVSMMKKRSEASSAA